MSKISDILAKAGTFYVATVDGDQPKVRPFGAIADIDGKTYTCTNNTKDVYKQLMKNPKTEICGSLPEGKWVRVSASLVRDDRDATRAKMLEKSPGLQRMYKIGDGIFEVLCFENAVATVYSFGGAPEVITD